MRYNTVRNVQIEGTKSGVGAVGGGAVAEEKLTRKAGLEITVKLDSGPTIAVVQEADIMYSVGERVRVLSGPDGTTRVAR